jgi:lactate racemase
MCPFEGNWQFLQTASPEYNKGDVIEDALTKSGNGKSLSEFVNEKKRFAILVPDQTRKCRLDFILPKLFKHLKSYGIHRSQRTILFANGTHSGKNQEIMRELVGDDIFQSVKIVNHSSISSDVVYLGTTNRGTKVSLNRLVAESEGVIAIGPVMHHYFAGFGGGPKLLVPGTAHQETIFNNHKLTINNNGNFESKCAEGVLDGNPVYEDIVEAVRMCPPTWYLGFVMDEKDNFLFAESGDTILTHRRLSAMASKTFEVEIEKPADFVIVSAGGYPRDITFIQTHKTIHHACAVVKQGGVVLCLAQCAEGIGSSTFLDWFKYSSSDDIAKHLVANYTLNGHTALALQQKTEKATIILISSLPHKDVEKMRLIPAANIEQGIAIARSKLENDFETYIMPHGDRKSVV